MTGNQPFYSLDGPLDSLPGDGQMRCANLYGFSRLVRGSGRDPRALLERHGIDPWLLRDPDHYIECRALIELLEGCSHAFNDSIFGLRLAQLQEPDVFGCITALCRSAPNVRQSIGKFIEFMPIVHSPETVLELVEGSDTAELRWSVAHDLGSNQQAHYQGALLSMKLLRQIGGPDFRPSYINLAVDSRRQDVPELERYLGCRLQPARSDGINAIAFPARLLEQCIPSANRLLFNLVGGYLGQVKTASRKTLTERVQDYVRGALPAGSCSIERCARKMGMSVRTLQANLQEADAAFSDLVQEQRVELARHYLRQPDLSLDDVAANLGYSEQSSFGRAFRRWTGRTPKQFRRETGSR